MCGELNGGLGGRFLGDGGGLIERIDRQMEGCVDGSMDGWRDEWRARSLH